MTFAVVSIHDVAPITRPQCEALVDAAERIGAVTSLLVVPGPWKYPAATEVAGFADWLAALERRGHEIVAHGWEHRAVADPDGDVDVVRRRIDRVLTRGCAEFGALGHDEARRRASRSLETLRRLGFDPTGFVAPGWSMSRAAADAVREVGYAYTTTRLSIVDHHGGRGDDGARSIPAPALCHRPGSALSALGARMLVAVTEHRAAAARPVRLALHPADLDDDRLMRATTRALDTIARSPLEATTYGNLIEACRSTRPRLRLVEGGVA